MNSPSQQQYLDFLLEVLQATQTSWGKAEVVYPLLQANVEKLDLNFAHLLYSWSSIQLFSGILESNYPLAATLGNFCLLVQNFTLDSKSKADRIEISLAGSNVVASYFIQMGLQENWAMSQHNIGAAYRERIYGNPKENLEKSIEAYNLALTVRTRKEFPQEWASTKHNLANVYSQRIEGCKKDNIETAIQYCREILSVRTKDEYPLQWANTQNTLAGLYIKRISATKREDLNSAISASLNALSVYSKENLPVEWARVKQSLGSAYLFKVEGDRDENIEAAVSNLQSALEVYTQNEFPEFWARTQCNLGIAYYYQSNHEKAIEVFESALQVFNYKDFSLDWAAAKTNLGNLYCDRTEDTKENNIEIAISHFKDALKIRTYDNLPEGWAETQNNLGNAYSDKAKALVVKNQENSKQVLREAVECYKKALKVRTRNALSHDWAMTQCNLGNAYSDLGESKKAMEAYKKALTVYTPVDFPRECINAGRGLGNQASIAKLWVEAIDGYSLAIKAVEATRNWSKSDSSRQEIIVEAIDIYIHLIQAYIETSQFDNAVEITEKLRSKQLVDLIASNDLYSEGKIHPKVERYLKKYDQLQKQIDRERLQNKINKRGEGYQLDRVSLEKYTDTIQKLENRKQQIWYKIRKHDPVLAGEIQVNPPDLEAIQKLIEQPTTVILSFFVTYKDVQVFVIRKDKVTLHTCAGEGSDILQEWIAKNWLKPYVEDNPSWRQTTNTFLAELSKRLQISQLIEQHLEKIEELIIVPHFLLHQIPFAALPVNHEEYLGDRFLIRYTPSCQILEFCHQRPEIKENWQYGIVENATGDLPCASIEGNQIAQLYKIPENLHLGEQKATCANYRELVQQVQVLHSCHHAHYSLKDPLNSALQLADGNITLGQLMTPGWRLPNLSDVFLSCCETGLGLPNITDDVLTLASGFLCAGARSVISTLWSVDDLATTLFSGFYYQYRQAGKSRTEALQQSQIKLRSHNIKDLANDLTIILEQVKTKRNQANREMKKHDRNSTEASQLMEKYIRYDQVIKQIKTLMKQSPETCPFAHPQYWSAFTCQGLH